MIVSLRHFLGWMASACRSREDLVFENLALRRLLLALHAQRPRHRLTAPAQAVLGCVENVLGRVEEASRLGHSPNRRELASSGVSCVLGMGLKIQTSGRTEACQQRGSCINLPYDCRESDLGSTAYSWRTAQAWIRCFGKECLAMDPASPKRSRGNWCDGLLSRPNAHVWCSVLLFRYRPRPA
jgi:hypothetical protein